MNMKGTQKTEWEIAKYKQNFSLCFKILYTVFHVSFTGIIFSEFNEFPENR